MKITYLTQQTWEQVREKDNKEPSLTRESDFVPIEELFARFQCSEALMKEVFKPIAHLTAEEKEVLYKGTEYDDLADEDILVQKEFIDSVKDSVSELKPEEKVNESNANQTVKQDDPQPSTDKATEVK